MAHIQTQRLKLWKPQNLSVDKINSQKMFVDNVDLLEAFALSTMKKSAQPVSTITELKAIDTSDTSVYVNGTIVMVKNKGIYFFDRSSTSTGDDNVIVEPTTGGGRWISDTTFITSMSTIGNIPNVTTNNQTPTYTTASTLTTLTSGEKLSVAMGKIKKSIDDFIAHKGSTSNPHSVTKSQIGLGAVPNVTTNNQTPTYTQASTLTNISSGENLSVSMGKIKKAIADFITHKNSTSNPHSVTKSQIGLSAVPNVATNDQTPTYTQASTLTNLVSGEKLSVSMGKIMKAIAELDNKYTKDASVSIADGEVGTATYSRLTGFSELNNKNLNDYKYSGQYGVTSTCTNRPNTTDPYGMLEVIMYSQHWVIQKYYALNGSGVINGIWYRSYYNGSTWTSWSKYTITTFNVVAEAEVIE